MECVRQYISDVLDFMADMHTPDQAEGKGLYPSSQGSERGRHSQELKRPDGNLSLPGEVAMAVLNELMSWNSEALGLPLQRGDGERKGVVSVPLCIPLFLPHLFSSYQAPYCKIFPFYECRH